MARYTKDEISTIVGTYNASAEAGDDYEARTEVVKVLASARNVSENVIRGILVAEKVYKSKEAAASSATSGVKKEDIVTAIEAFMGIKMSSLKNMSLKDLKAFWERLVEMSDIRNAELGKK